MVFNWFRRKYRTSEASSEEAETENLTVEQEQEAAEENSEEPVPETSPAVAEDYLNWAKAAYKNIQKQQASVVEPAVTPTETVESEEPVTPETPTTAETPPQKADSLREILAAEEVTVESADALSPPETTTEVVELVPAELTENIPETTPSVTVESADALSPPETTAEVVELVPAVSPATEVAAFPEASSAELEVSGDDGIALSQEEVTAPEIDIAQSPNTAEEAGETVAQVPIWARESSAQRQARLERLQATAIEIPEPEPVKASAPPEELAVAATTSTEEEVPGFAFDEGFLWSAQVLAAQGRRPEDVSIEEISWLKRLRLGLSKTRRSLINQLKAIVGQGPLNQDAVVEIEALLLQADVGVEATDYIINTLQQKLREEVLPPEEAIAYLKKILRELLDRPLTESYTPTFVPEKDTLNIWLMTGVNGVGKTTTIGKLAHLATKSGYRCLIGAADTFRAAAVEQVKIWGERSGTEVIANPGKNTDPAAVVFDAIAAAQSRNIELLLVDTAGRLQNKKNLMAELSKIRQIVDKKAPNAKVESLLVLDATLGQNGLLQAQVFSEAAKLSGVVLTKLDGTAKGGVALAVVQQLGLPIRFIGAGEGIEDLRPFSSYEFVEALLSG